VVFELGHVDLEVLGDQVILAIDQQHDRNRFRRRQGPLRGIADTEFVQDRANAPNDALWKATEIEAAGLGRPGIVPT
jgi:hypothetical protein